MILQALQNFSFSKF